MRKRQNKQDSHVVEEVVEEQVVSQSLQTGIPENKPEPERKSVRYVVVRDGYRVEDREYDNPDDPFAVATRDFWKKVATKHSWGEKVDIVQYDPKIHRVW